MPCKITEEQLVNMIDSTQDQDGKDYLIAMYEKYFGGWGLYALAGKINHDLRSQHAAK